MDLSKAQLNEYRLHTVTVLTAASAAMSQIDEFSQYAPLTTTIAFLVAATSYKDALSRVDEVIDALEDADIIDEDVADAVEEVVDAVEAAVDIIDE